ncbi:MAG TPA: protein kinase [Bryobacteraceae bacterium]
MTPERWQQVKRVFDEAVEREPQERGGFLDAACKGDNDLRAEVASLLAAREDAGSRYDAAIVAIQTETKTMDGDAGSRYGAVVAGQTTDPMVGRRVSTYKIVRRLGSGGMGAVYLASRDDLQFRRLVAIKMIRPELLDENTRRRFDNERQTLAALEHPNIVKLVDGGTTEDGWPYLIMDYVEGQPIDRFVKERDLSTPERLELFRALCAAVHYAHQNLIVHRDLKPANILVTPQGIPKLLDFGIAKLLRPAFAQGTAGFTRTEAQPMTPEYASPEQILGSPITTATDIYSLGVLLYTLLTGMHPYRATSQSMHELEISICEGNPKKPSAALEPVAPAAARHLRGDLDTIVLTAIRKEPQRRYSSAEHLAEDVRRHLQHEPLAARPDTVWYRTQKFVERNKWAVATSAVVAIALATMGVMDRIDRQRAELDDQRAERRFQDLRSFANFAILDLDKAMAKGLTPARQVLAVKAVGYLDDLAKDLKSDTSIKVDLMRGYLKVGDIVGNPSQDDLGDTAGARQNYEKAVAIAETLRPGDLKDPDVRALVALCEENLADLLEPAGERAEAIDRYSKALEILQGDLEPSLYPLQKIADLRADDGDPAAALETSKQLEQTASEWAAKNPASAGARRGVAFAQDRSAGFALQTGDPTVIGGAETAARSALAIYQSANPTPDHRRTTAIEYKRLAEVLRRENKKAEALDDIRSARSITRDLLSHDQLNERSRVDETQETVLLIGLLNETGRKEQARHETAAALAKLEPLIHAETPNLFYLTDYVSILDDTLFPEFVKSRNVVETARKAAAAGKDWETLDLLARALERAGNLGEAAETETKALNLLPPAKPGRPKPENRKNLEESLARMSVGSAPPGK